MNFIHFGLRMEIERLYLEWCEEEGIANKPNSMVVFFMEKGWLNEEKIIEDLKEPKTGPQTEHKKWETKPTTDLLTVNTTCVGVAMALVEDDFFRNPTAEERKAIADYIDSISVPTGVNVFDLMDEAADKEEKLK